MGFDLQDLRAAVARHGTVTRVVIAALRGSSPREVGAAMLVWQDGQSGTIGGGALEFEATVAARKPGAQARRVSHHALGPDLGQCCGGAVTLLSEVYDADMLAQLEVDVVARPAGGDDSTLTEMPLTVRRALTEARGQGIAPEPQLIEGWMIEPVHRAERALWIWGAGHVGRALVQVLAPLPEFEITWIDSSAERFPSDVPAGVTVVPAAHPADLVAHAPITAEHLVLTYSHTLDLELCHRLLQRGFGAAGLIGSATKWARFRSRLAGLGHSALHVGRITCPIGDPALGKHPHMIAIGVAADLLRHPSFASVSKDIRA